MKINIENYLHRIDSAFKDKTQKDMYMTYIMIFSVIFAFSYLLFWDSSFEHFKQKQTKITSLENKIMSDNLYLKINPESKIAKLKQDIKLTNAQVLIHKDNNAYIKNKIETISFLIYDERAWGEYLYSISKNAKKHNVKILNFSNNFAPDSDSFGHILDISIKSVGNYKNTLKFINSLEQSNLVVDIHHLNIQAKDKLSADLNLSVWGITY